MSSKGLASVLPLFLVLLIDSMGLGLLFPVLSSMIIDPHSLFLAASTSHFTRQFLYGLIIGIYMMCWFFGAAILGDLSDMIGRKKSLMICLIGAAIGFLVSGAAIMIHNIPLLIVGRVIAGFTAGSQPIAQAAIVDVSSKEKKARNIGLILLFISLGFVIGPLAGGVLSDKHLVSWFNFSTPMFFAALMSLINIFYLLFAFHETFEVTRKLEIKLLHAVSIFVSAFRHKKIRYLSLILLLFIFGWANYYSFISAFLIENYHYTPLQAGLFLMMLGIGFSIGFGYLVERLANRFKLKNCIVIAIIISSAFTLITGLIHIAWLAWVLTVFIGMGVAVAYSMIITLFSDQVGETEQGWVMGVTGSIMALCFGLTTFASGFAADVSINLPILLSFSGLLISGLLMLFASNSS